MTFDINEMTIGDWKSLSSMFGSATCRTTSIKQGQKYLVETATKYYLGCVCELTDETIVLEDSCWIADTGRFADFMQSGKPNEAEPVYAKTHIPRTSINAMHEWEHDLCKEQK